jgi:IS30 family transposase
MGRPSTGTRGLAQARSRLARPAVGFGKRGVEAATTTEIRSPLRRPDLVARFSVYTSMALPSAGSHQNINGLLRQHFPKGSDLSGYSHVDLDVRAPTLH